jgi:hypothetical protein
MRPSRFAAFICLSLATTPALAGDPRAPGLAVAFLAEPAPIVQYRSTRVAYEMMITNFSPRPYVLDAVAAKVGELPFAYSGAVLAGMIKHLGATPAKDSPAERTIEGGGSIIVYFLLDVGDETTPGLIRHLLTVHDESGEAHAIEPAPVPVSAASPIVVAPPLRGAWIAGDALNNGPDAAHRRTIIVEDGHPWLAQRYAIDWVQAQTVDEVLTTWTGAEDKNESYFCYDQPIYSVAAGRVVEVADGMPNNVPHSGKYAVAIDLNNAAGNHVVVAIAPRRYVLYAHMRPGSVRVKRGDKVAAGDILGNVGNTGSSTEPHLHMHIDDHPSFLAGNGVPYEFTAFEASGPVEANVSSATVIKFGTIGPQRPFTNDYPANNALVTFK